MIIWRPEWGQLTLRDVAYHEVPRYGNEENLHIKIFMCAFHQLHYLSTSSTIEYAAGKRQETNVYKFNENFQGKKTFVRLLHT
jgi:hypothetical protein